MQRMQFYKKSSCVCGKCGQIFDSSEEPSDNPQTIEELPAQKHARSRSRMLYGIEITEKVCPHCGSTGYTPLSLEKWAEKYLFI